MSDSLTGRRNLADTVFERIQRAIKSRRFNPPPDEPKDNWQDKQGDKRAK